MNPTRGLLLVTVAALPVLAGCSGGAGSSSGPSAWDARIQPIVDAVQQDRGLTFVHPVKVNYLSTAAFEKLVGQGDAPSASDRAALQQQASELRALGLASGPLDLANLETKADQVDTVGYYDTDTKQIYVEGTALTPYVRVTVAHELTHVLQDQRLNLAKLDNLPDDQQTAVSALVEGDAVTVENDYESSLSSADQKLYDQESSAINSGSSGNSGNSGNSGAGNSGSAGGGEPDFLADAASFPYDFGPPFVDALLASGGNARLNAAFDQPPTVEADVVDPSRYLAHIRAVSVAVPPLPAGAKRLQPPAAFGQVSMAEVLGTRLGYAAWGDVAGWSGDTSVLYGIGNQTCVVISTAFDSAASASRFESGARQWVSSLPATSDASVTSTGTTVSITACDPGSQAAVAPPLTPGVYDVLVARADLIDQLLNGPVTSAARAECMADAAVAKLGPAAAVAWDQSDSGAPSDSDVQQAEKSASCPA